MTSAPQPTDYPDVVETVRATDAKEKFVPYIPPWVEMRELTPLPVIVGTLLGMIFGASSLYLVLKVGITVSASIPVAVISITLFKILAKLGMKEATILENNVVQTSGSAGESIAFGVGVTMPAIMILGFDLEITRVMLVAILGGLLGILMMIPLRRALIVNQHGLLKYPEGTACAEVLKAGASEESRAVAAKARGEDPQAVDLRATSAKTIFTGFAIGVVYKSAMSAFRVWKDTPGRVFGEPLRAGSVHAEISPELLGVGYIIGPRIAALMAGGGVLAYLVLIPMIKFFGDFVQGVVPPATMPIRDMSPNQIRGDYVLYIGAGAVAAAGIISVFRSMPTIWGAIKAGLKDVRGARGAAGQIPRTDRDLPMTFVLGGILLLIIAMVIARPLQVNILGAILIIIFGFLFVTVSSRLTGEIGSTSNPISGMTYATLLLTSLIFLALGHTERPYYVTALSIGAIVCIAASNGGTTSQDLKTGFLVGATPYRQQIAILIGAFASALILGPILLRLNDGATVYVRSTGYSDTGVRVDPSAIATLPPAAPELLRGAPPQGTYRTWNVGEGPAGYPGLTSGQYLVNESTGQVYKYAHNFPPTLRADPNAISERRERLRGPMSGTDSNTYRTWQNTDTASGHAGKYLVDDQGIPVYLLDPGINGKHPQIPGGSEVKKFDAPKAVLVSYIIKGILDRELPWGLVLLGVMIAVTLEMCGIPSLAFAVGVYLPLSTSLTVFIGGAIRWAVDLYLRKKFARENMTEEQLVAETDKSAGVLMASGYIAGGAIAGIIIAFMAGFPAMEGFNKTLEKWSEGNPFFTGANSDLLALIPFGILVLTLYLTGREILFKSKAA